MKKTIAEKTITVAMAVLTETITIAKSMAIKGDTTASLVNHLHNVDWSPECFTLRFTLEATIAEMAEPMPVAEAIAGESIAIAKAVAISETITVTKTMAVTEGRNNWSTVNG
ncbi:hypothetical protein HPB47_004746 [Ixodes persulcatus]|uniref:Uncharacterized protein n=1 Tax=Ixodes persulcatus TaxID=34615 RepID=A0AC60PEV0_IXOPE|nr:hypothetical protein HPB47_004746 [Ixodes persulcatus]